jgi:hypothetical protein
MSDELALTPDELPPVPPHITRLRERLTEILGPPNTPPEKD